MLRLRKSIAVVGAGPSGLAAIKELLEEGHLVKGFEKAAQIGGLFRFRQDGGGVYKSCVLTSSIPATSYSDFPCGIHSKHFLTHEEYIEYLESYAAHFDIHRHICLSTEVLRIIHFKSGWRVESRNAAGVVTVEAFDAVAVCSGVHQAPSFPSYVTEGSFMGEVLHSSRYKSPEPFKGKRVLIVGAGESGADIIDEVSRVAERCVLSLRRGVWVLPRLIGGVPNDYFTSRLFYSLPDWLLRSENPAPKVKRSRRGAMVFLGPIYIPFLVYEFLRRRIQRLRRRWWPRPSDQPPRVIDLIARLRQQSGGGLAEQFVTKSDKFVHCLADGRCELKAAVRLLDGTRVTFCDGSEMECDSIVLCTGYQLGYSFLQPMVDDLRKLYLNCFLPEVGNTLCIIGAARPGTGSIPPIAEMQSRLFAQVCSGQLALPSVDEMQRDVVRCTALHKEKFQCVTERLDHLVDYTSYMDTLAALIGCKPRMAALLRKPKLLYKVYCAHFSCSQYRLTGPHSAPELATRQLEALRVAYSKVSIVFMFALLAASKVYNKLGIKFLEPHLRLD